MSELTAVQRPMLKYADQIGWKFIDAETVLEKRGGEAGLFLMDVLEDQLIALNPGIVTPDNVGDVIRQLTLLRPNIEGNQQALEWLRGEQSVFVPAENRERNVTLIDFENIDRNLFHVTEEWRHKNYSFGNRADVMFLINGVPVALAETKYAGKPEGLAEGIDQIRRYHRETPEMLTSTQIFEVTELVNFFYGVSWNTSRKNLFNWKDEQPGDYERKVKGFFDRERILQFLKDYIVFLKQNDELTKVILRQHQTRAVEKVIERVQDPHKRHGLIWHTQGSGKTLTMITIAALLLRDKPGAVKPLVLMLIDRSELEHNIFKNITSYGITNVKIAEGKKDLQNILGSDYRGLVVSMIHKFDDIPAKINTGSHVVVLVDEAHRTTGGDLGNYLMGALPKANYIGFTGTPIDKISKGKGTFKVFGVDDEGRGFLDKYSIAESIADGTTVQLNYALAPSTLRVDKETLEKHFLAMAESEGVTDIEELNAMLDRAVELKQMMKSPTRVDAIAQFVAEHFKENVEPMGFKAFLVGVDRPACVLLKEALDQYLPTEYSTVVYSAAHNDTEDLKRHQISLEDEKRVRKEFIQKNTQPKILIVTEKLLTGFDAPILYCMYLDKPMRDHVLLQTIARVNRPYEDVEGQVKPYGFILDFVGIFENLEKALAFDSEEVASVIQNIDVLKKLFDAMMTEQAPHYLPFAKGKDDKAKDKAIQQFEDKERREALFKFFRQLQNLYDVISPDSALRPYMEDYQDLAGLYGLIRNAYADKAYVDRELTRKTKKLLQEHTTLEQIEMPDAVYELGAEQLALIRDSQSSDITKILNLRKLLNGKMQNEGNSKPFLISIAERAEKLQEAYEDRQLTTQQTLEAFEELTEEIIEGDTERKHLNVDENTFAIYTVLKPILPDISPQQSQKLNELFEKRPNYTWNALEKRTLRSELYKELLPLIGSQRMIDVANTLLSLQRVKIHGYGGKDGY